MPDPITWYLLPKTVVDPTTIDEQIDAGVLAHNVDPSAHGQSAESLYEHRVSPLIDHINYSIYNLKIAPAIRTYRAIVDPAGDGDFRTIQEAIDYVKLFGGGRILLKAGTYTLDDHLTLYSNIQLIGEDDDLTILDFNNTAKYIKCEGTSGTHKSNINIANLKIINNLNDGLYVIRFYYCDDSRVRNCFFENNHGVDDPIQAIHIEQSDRVFVDGNRFDDCDYCVYLYYSDYCHVDRNFANDCDHNFVYNSQSKHTKIRDNEIADPNPAEAANGIIETATGSYYLVISGNTIENCKSAAIYLDNTARSSIIGNNFDATTGSGNGIDIGTSNRITIVGNNVRNFDGDCIALADGDRIEIVGNCLTDSTGWGVNIDADSYDSLVVGNNVYNNAAGTIQDNGVGTMVDSNVF